MSAETQEFNDEELTDYTIEDSNDKKLTGLQLVPLERIQQRDVEQSEHYFVQVEGVSVDVVRTVAQEGQHRPQPSSFGARLFTRQLWRRHVW